MYILASLLLPHLVSALAIGSRDSGCLRAAYFLNNDPAGSSIVSLKIAEDGTVSDPISTSTGGKGLLGLTAGANGAAATAGGADTLFSQDAVVVQQDYLFTVNAGSKTVSMFFIDKNNPYEPKLLNTAPTLGDFPVSVAYSPKHKTACVLNGGATAGVTCFATDHAKGLTPLGGLRSISLGQSTPPVGPPNTVSDITFNPSESALFATVKGSPTSPGFIYVYPVTNSKVSTTPTISSPAGVLLDFSLSFLGCDDKAVISDPAYGASLLSISPTFEVTVAKKITVAGEGAICWSEYSSRFNTIFLMDAGSANITLVDPQTGNIKGAVVQSDFATNKGNLDAALDRTFLYVLRGGDAVSVLDNTGLSHGEIPREIQSFGLSVLGSRQGFQGLSIYPSS